MMRCWAMVCAALMLLVGCDDEAPGSGAPGVGEACSAETPCAEGLTCEDSICVASGDVLGDSVADTTNVDSTTDDTSEGDTSEGDTSPTDATEETSEGDTSGDTGVADASDGADDAVDDTASDVAEDVPLNCSVVEKICGEGASALCCSRTEACGEAGCETCPTERLCTTTCCEEGFVCEDDACLPACEGVRCGGSEELCCTGSEVCIFDACLVPGDACTTSLECGVDDYCDPTLEACLPRSANTSVCESLPDFGNFTPAKEGELLEVEVDGATFSNSITTPVVADIDNDGLPEIAVNFYLSGGLSDAVLVIINGEDMSVAATSAVGLIQPNSAGVAVGQLDDSTPELEIVAVAAGGGLVAFRHDGSTWWENTSGSLGGLTNHSAPALADMDGDGAPEIVLGFSVVSADGQTLIQDGGQAADNFNQTGGISAVVDMDGVVNTETGQRELELVAGNRVMRLDGSMLWDVSDTIDDGYPAVADFGNDGQPDVVNVANGEVMVLDGSDGSVSFGPIAIPSGSQSDPGSGGPPTVADFDGDGFVEFAAAGRGAYTVYDLDCQGTPDPARCASERSDGVLWTVEVQDLSSSVTGSSVFDFDGDGKAEVVYNDECFLRVFDGTDGTVLYEQANSSRTGSENPIIVDVDGDFKAEIVVVSNNDEIDRDNCDANPGYPAGGTHGIFVYGDATDNWVPTRRLWNQHSYHITNVEDDGAIPTQETLHYTQALSNNFRLNTQGEGLFNAPDLAVDSITTNVSSCPSELVIRVTVTNDGSLGVPAGVWVVVRVTDSAGDSYDVGRVQTAQALLPGATETVEISWTPQGSGPYSVEAEVDLDPDGGSVFRECREDNNTGSEGDITCSVN